MAVIEAFPEALSWHDLTYGDLERALVSSGVPAIHARPLWKALHKRGEDPLTGREQMLPPVLEDLPILEP